MTKSELVEALIVRGAGDRKHVTNMLKALEEEVCDALEAGEDIIIPGIVKIQWTYRKPAKKGERWKKGDTRVAFGGEEVVAEEDSPVVKPKIGIKASVTGSVYRIRPKTKPEEQAAFLKTKTAKAVIKRKG